MRIVNVTQGFTTWTCRDYRTLLGAEFIMPGHWERFVTYMDGNLDALTSWIQ